MQQIVNTILEAAEGSGQFHFVSDEVFDENEQYPALIVTERRRRLNEAVSTAQVYFSEWQYTIVIMVHKTDGYEKLEAVVQAFLKQLFQKNTSGTTFFALASEVQYEAYISEYHVLVSRLSINATVKSTYL